MKISQLKKAARLRMKPQGKKPYELAFFVFSIAIAAQFCVDAIGFGVSSYQGGQGLDGMGTASLLQTVEELLSTVLQFIRPFWMLGFTAAVMAFLNWQDASRDTLFTGLRRLFPLLRLYLLEGVITILVAIVVYFPAICLYAMTPWASSLIKAIREDPSFMDNIPALMEAATPMVVIYGIVIAIAMIPVMYRLRFSQYLLLSGHNGALFAMVTSFRLTKGRMWTICKLDLSYWWYYLATGLLVGVYIAVPLLSSQLGLTAAGAFWLSSGVYALGSLALEALAQPRITAVNVLLYRCAIGLN